MSPLRKAAEAAAGFIIDRYGGDGDDEKSTAAIEAVARAHAERVLRSAVQAYVWHGGPCVFLGRGALKSVAERFDTLSEAEKHVDAIVKSALARAKGAGT